MLIKFRRARIKKWGTLFTYFFTRSAHIEVVHGLDTDSFINSLVRFIIAEENQIILQVTVVLILKVLLKN